MINEQKDNLFLLIKSLTKSKRQFKLYEVMGPITMQNFESFQFFRQAR